MQAGMAKLFASEVGVEAALEAMRIHGGYGYSKEFVVERLYREAPLSVIGEGTSDILRTVIARNLISGKESDRLSLDDPLQARSHLYVPGDKPDVLAKAARPWCRRAHRRPRGRRRADGQGPGAPIVTESAHDPAGRRREPGRIWVRINSGGRCAIDVAAVARPAVTGFCVAKTESVEEIENVAPARRVEENLDLAFGRSRSYRCSSRRPPCFRAREHRAGAAGASGCRSARPTCAPTSASPSATTSASCSSSARWSCSPRPPRASTRRSVRSTRTSATSTRSRTSTRAVQRLGFLGRACIHPAQVAVVNDVFTPNDDEVARARDLLSRFEAAGSGIALDAEGRMVDEAVARQARLVLARSRST